MTAMTCDDGDLFAGLFSRNAGCYIGGESNA